MGNGGLAGFRVGLIGAFIALAIPAAAAAQDRAGPIPRIIAALHIPSLFGQDGHGPYGKLHRQVLRDAGLSVPLVLMPPARATTAFNSGRALCLFPSSVAAGVVTVPAIDSRPVNHFKIHILAPPGAPPMGLDDLAGLRVGGVLGFEGIYGDLAAAAGARMEYARDEATNLRKLVAGRLDASIAVFPDALIAGRELGLTLNHDAAAPLMVFEETYVCRDDEDGRALVARLNEAIARMQAGGVLRDLLGDSLLGPGPSPVSAATP